MSFKYTATKVGNNHYVLPKVAGMKTDVHAFLSDDLYAASEEKTWDQAAAGASYEGVTGAYLMPDTHVGPGVPVGCVIITDNTIIQSVSGYDISCGVLHLKIPGLSAKKLQSKERRWRWVKAVEKRIAVGIGSHRADQMRTFTTAQLDEILRHGIKPLGINADLCERDHIAIREGVDLTKVETARARAIPQLGSVGGGNHFVELQCDQETGQGWAMIHCGSRGYGHQVADHFFVQGALLRGIPLKHREQSWLRADEPLGKEYWAYHNSAANYAIANRHIIVQGIQEALEEVYDVQGEVYYEISHNLVQEETLVLPDGTTKKGFVHRKGATRAFPAGHPDLVGTRWEATGHPCLIPGSMFTGAAVLFPMQGAYSSGCSVNHGSGRILARGHAKRKLEHKQERIDAEMDNVKRVFNDVTIEGIVRNTKKTPLDECAHVYKDLDEVLATLVDAGIARIAHRLYPVASIKGAD
jgi:tRNA-splicing ligase RtcB